MDFHQVKNGIDETRPLLYQWEIQNAQIGELRGRYVGKAGPAGCWHYWAEQLCRNNGSSRLRSRNLPIGPRPRRTDFAIHLEDWESDPSFGTYRLVIELQPETTVEQADELARQLSRLGISVALK